MILFGLSESCVMASSMPNPNRLIELANTVGTLLWITSDPHMLHHIVHIHSLVGHTRINFRRYLTGAITVGQLVPHVIPPQTWRARSRARAGVSARKYPGQCATPGDRPHARRWPPFFTMRQ